MPGERSLCFCLLMSIQQVLLLVSLCSVHRLGRAAISDRGWHTRHGLLLLVCWLRLYCTQWLLLLDPVHSLPLLLRCLRTGRRCHIDEHLPGHAHLASASRLPLPLLWCAAAPCQSPLLLEIVDVSPGPFPILLRYVYLAFASVSYFHLEGLVTDVLVETKVHCTAEDLYVYQPPSNMTCGEYSANFLSYATGYIDNPSATSDCGYCSYSTGADYYNTIPWTEDHRWRDFGIFSAYWVFNIGLVVLLVWFSRKPRR